MVAYGDVAGARTPRDRLHCNRSGTSNRFPSARCWLLALFALNALTEFWLTPYRRSRPGGKGPTVFRGPCPEQDWSASSLCLRVASAVHQRHELMSAACGRQDQEDAMIYVVNKLADGRWFLAAVSQRGARTDRSDYTFDTIGALCTWLTDHAPERFIVVALAGRNQLEAVYGGPDVIII